MAEYQKIVGEWLDRCIGRRVCGPVTHEIRVVLRGRLWADVRGIVDSNITEPDISDAVFNLTWRIYKDVGYAYRARSKHDV